MHQREIDERFERIARAESVRHRARSGSIWNVSDEAVRYAFPDGRSVYMTDAAHELALCPLPKGLPSAALHTELDARLASVLSVAATRARVSGSRWTATFVVRLPQHPEPVTFHVAALAMGHPRPYLLIDVPRADLDRP